MMWVYESAKCALYSARRWSSWVGTAVGLTIEEGRDKQIMFDQWVKGQPGTEGFLWRTELYEKDHYVRVCCTQQGCNAGWYTGIHSGWNESLCARPMRPQWDEQRWRGKREMIRATVEACLFRLPSQQPQPTHSSLFTGCPVVFLTACQINCN